MPLRIVEEVAHHALQQSSIAGDEDGNAGNGTLLVAGGLLGREG